MAEAGKKRYPEYKRVYDALRSKIASGEYATKSLLPPEPELEAMFQVSRTTVRKAVELLIQEGLVVAKQGFGTQVINRKTVQNLNRLTSISQTLENMGYTVGTKSIYVQTVPAQGELAEELGLPEETPLVCINRIQTANGSPITFTKNYIAASLVPDLTHTKEKIISWYAYLSERYGIVITGAKDMISACTASFEESELLQIAPGSALLTIHRICSGESGPVEIDQVKIVASRYELEVYMQG